MARGRVGAMLWLVLFCAAPLGSGGCGEGRSRADDAGDPRVDVGSDANDLGALDLGRDAAVDVGEDLRPEVGGGGDAALDATDAVADGDGVDAAREDSGNDVAACPGGAPLSACGGCEALEAELGSACGTCGSGLWECAAADTLTCAGDLGEDGLNACGGCAELAHEPRAACDSCGGVVCAWQCAGEAADELVCAAFARIEPATFAMGSPVEESGRSANETQVTTTLTHTFWILATEVTRGQYRAVMGYDASVDDGCGDDCPVDLVSWWEAAAYANALSDAEDLDHCYTLTGCAGTLGVDWVCEAVAVTAEGGDPYLCEGYRLPTEAEWEYAVRAGTTTATFAGELVSLECEDTTVADIAWFCGNAEGRAHVAGTRLPNDWGLHDMLGSVWEWVWDGYEEAYAGSRIDPYGPADGKLRVIRGGAWNNVAAYIRASQRRDIGPEARVSRLGFRVARTGP